MDLLQGWNIIGFTSNYPQDAEEGTAEIRDIISILKDNNADVYLPEYNFNGIGDLLPGHGYQLKTLQTYQSFSFPNNIQLGCTNPTSSNFDENALVDNGSCEATPSQIGDLAHGGIVFYIDEGGEHGLVAALEDITEGSNQGTYGIPEGFEWGCTYQIVNGADGQSIGTGYQNTLDIVAQNCQTHQGGITAAQACLSYETEGFTDWYLPSIDELNEMHSVIGNVELQANIGGFETDDHPYYWSSTEYITNYAWLINFSIGYSGTNVKYNSFRVRAVRSF